MNKRRMNINKFISNICIDQGMSKLYYNNIEY